jgi:3-oxoacyl-[acyl-carrier-protein] synthase II
MTLHCDEPDPECNLDIVRGAARPASNPVFLKTSLTRHGQAAALLISGNSPSALDASRASALSVS